MCVFARRGPRRGMSGSLSSGGSSPGSGGDLSRPAATRVAPAGSGFGRTSGIGFLAHRRSQAHGHHCPLSYNSVIVR